MGWAGGGWLKTSYGGGIGWKYQNNIIYGEGSLKLLKKNVIWYVNVTKLWGSVIERDAHKKNAKNAQF